MIALEFPPIENLVEWPAYFGEDTFYAFNKIALISLLGMGIPSVLFLLAKKELVPRGVQNVMESAIEFVEKQVIMAAIGPDGEGYLQVRSIWASAWASEGHDGGARRQNFRTRFQ